MRRRMGIEDIVEQRLEMLQTETPGVLTRYDIEEDGELEWGVITISEEDGHAVGVEFVESEDSLRRPDALDQYNEAANSSGRVVVLVPDTVHDEAAEILLRGSNQAIELVSYGVVGITILA